MTRNPRLDISPKQNSTIGRKKKEEDIIRKKAEEEAAKTKKKDTKGAKPIVADVIPDFSKLNEDANIPYEETV